MRAASVVERARRAQERVERAYAELERKVAAKVQSRDSDELAGERRAALLASTALAIWAVAHVGGALLLARAGTAADAEYYRTMRPSGYWQFAAAAIGIRYVISG